MYPESLMDKYSIEDPYYRFRKDRVMKHQLKTWPIYFRELASKQKTFEFRKNDRDFKTGDHLTLLEYDAGAQQYTGASLDFTIGMVLYGPNFGIQDGYCVMSLLPPSTGIR